MFVCAIHIRSCRPTCHIFLAVGLLALLGAACDTQPTERITTIYALKEQPTEENIVEIRNLLDDPNRDVRATALNALVVLRVHDAAGLAVEGLDDEDGFVRSTAAKLIGDLQDPAFGTLLVKRLLYDPDHVVRQRAAEALARLGGEAAVAGLAAGLEDPNKGARLACVRGLKELDPGYAVQSLLRLLREDPMWEIRMQAATVLGLSGDPDAVPGLRVALEDPNEFVRSAAAHALGVHSASEAGAPESRDEEN